MTIDEFVKKYDGKFIDFDKAYGNQCFDLYRQYCQEVLQIPQSPPTGNQGAVKIWDTYLTQYFERIPNTPEGVPQKGDIMIWGTSYGPYGHVAIVTEATLTTFKCFSQNDPTGAACGIKLYRTYKPTLGWLRFKPKSKTYTEEEMIKIRLERDANWNLYQTELNTRQGLEETVKSIQNSHDSFVENLLETLNPFGNPLGLSDDELVKKLVSEIVNNETILQDKIKQIENESAKKQAELEQENKGLREELKRLGEEIIALEARHKAEIGHLQDKLNNINQQFETNQIEVKKVDHIKNLVDFIVSLFERNK